MDVLKRYEFNTALEFIGMEDDEVTPIIPQTVKLSEIEQDLEKMWEGIK